MRRLFLFLFVLAVLVKAEAQTSASAIGDSLYAVGNYSSAIKEYESINNKKESIYIKLARAHQAKGALDDALFNYEKAATGTDKAVAMTEYGKLLITKGKYEKADSIFTALIDVYTANPNFYYQRGRARENKPLEVDTLTLESLDSLKIYIKDYERAVELDSTHQKALYETALFYLKKKDYPVVEKLCKKALESYDTNVEIISLLAQNYFYRGFHDDAIIWFKKLIDLGKSSKFIHDKLGYCYYQERSYELAIEQYLLSLNYDPEDYYTHHNLAKLYNFLEDFKNAEKHGKMAIYLKDMSMEDEYYTLGNTYKIHKDWKQSMDYLNKALEEDSDYKKALYARAVVADNYYKDKEAVIRLYEDFIEKYDNSYDPLANLAKSRVKMLKQEVFMQQDN